MEIGDRVKFSHHFLEIFNDDKNKYRKYKDRVGTIIRFSKDNFFITVKWIGLKTEMTYHYNFIEKTK